RGAHHAGIHVQQVHVGGIRRPTGHAQEQHANEACQTASPAIRTSFARTVHRGAPYWCSFSGHWGPEGCGPPGLALGWLWHERCSLSSSPWTARNAIENTGGGSLA